MNTKASKHAGIVNTEQSNQCKQKKKTTKSYTGRSSQQNPTARMVSDNHLWTFEMCVRGVCVVYVCVHVWWGVSGFHFLVFCSASSP